MVRLTRRQFFGFVTSSVLTPLLGCGGSGSIIANVPPDIMLPDEETQLASLLQRQFDRLKSLAETPNTTLRIGVPVGRQQEVLAFSFRDDGVARYRHLRVVRESTGEAVNLLWGWKGLLPSVMMVDDAGQPVKRSGRAIEVGFVDLPTQGRQALDLIAAGVKVAAIAFAIWLGVGVGRAVLSAIGFLAFNAMVLGLLAAAIGVFLPAIKWVLDNITLDDVERFFRRLVDDIIGLLREIAGLLAEGLP